jgi:hypothetical protein
MGRKYYFSIKEVPWEMILETYYLTGNMIRI